MVKEPSTLWCLILKKMIALLRYNTYHKNLHFKVYNQCFQYIHKIEQSAPLIVEHSHAKKKKQKKTSQADAVHFPNCSPWQPFFCFLSLSTFHINGIMQDMACFLTSFGYQCFQVPFMSCCISVLHSFLSLNNIPLHEYFVYSSVGGYLSCFHFFILNNVSTKHSSTRFCIEICFSSLGFMPRNGVAGSHDNSFNFLRNYQTLHF